MRDIMLDFQNENVKVQNIIISELLDEFMVLYSSGRLNSFEQLECLDFINTLFRLKHRFILDYNKERRTFSRDMQMYHLKKIYSMAKLRIRKVSRQPSKKYEASENVLEFRGLITSLHRKYKKDITKKTKMLLDELMRERWTVQDKASLLRDILNSKDARFQDMLETKDVEEVITSFLTLLDLKRNHEIEVVQDRNFGEIIIKKI